jgi:hypothetical protein
METAREIKQRLVAKCGTVNVTQKQIAEVRREWKQGRNEGRDSNILIAEDEPCHQ